jgi:hypothetical protein
VDDACLSQVKDAAGSPAKFRPEMKMLVSAVIRSTLTPAIRPGGGDLRLYVFCLQTALTSVAITEFKGFRPLCTAQPDLDGVTDQFFRGDFFFGRSFLDLLKKLAGKPYVFSRHGYILLLLRENITPFAIVNAYKLAYTLPRAWRSVAPDLLLKRVCGKVIAWSRYDEIHPHKPAELIRTAMLTVTHAIVCGTLMK